MNFNFSGKCIFRAQSRWHYRKSWEKILLHGNDSQGIRSQTPWERFPQPLCLRIPYILTTAAQQLLLAD